MKKAVIFLISLFFLGIITIKAQDMTEKEKSGYAGGVLLAELIKSEKLEFIFDDLKEEGFIESLRAGFRDAIDGNIKLSNEEIMNTLEIFQQKARAMQKQENEPEKKENQGSINYQFTIAQHYTSISWYYLFTKEYVQSEQSAYRALALDSTYLLPKTNLAHALLFQNRFSEAETIYKELSQTIYQDNETYTQALLNDFAELEKAGVIPEEHKTDVEKIKQMLQIQK